MRVDIQGKFEAAIGTVKDHAAIGKAMIYNHEGKCFSDIEIAVVRATAHDNVPIDDKHMHQILFLCQVFIDKVLDCSPIHILPSDNLAQAAMSNTLKESFQVYMTYCEGIAALVNMFFDFTMPARALACQILQRASQQSQKLHNLYENCKRIIDNKNLEYPIVQIISMDHVKTLEQCSKYHSPVLECLANKPTN
ncbi:hypothetical protein GH714_018948 [Hevea brasiliensis]|uniref:AP180 N-terminal homology (ANTH) domain-containing protein n=1 Tax=Hevea brasiliensis TaxID=3981 RepID=A0A6A6MUL4_HEVBR|nr:hypothetical protein GH714_018948 [Hevea brasiliensis]